MSATKRCKAVHNLLIWYLANTLITNYCGNIIFTLFFHSSLSEAPFWPWHSEGTLHFCQHLLAVWEGKWPPQWWVGRLEGGEEEGEMEQVGGAQWNKERWWNTLSLSFQVSLSLGGSDVVLNICPHGSTLQLYTLKGSTRYPGCNLFMMHAQLQNANLCTCAREKVVRSVVTYLARYLTT